MTLSEVDLDEIHACANLTDVVNLLLAKDIHTSNTYSAK
jgi:hypothetical protein